MRYEGMTGLDFLGKGLRFPFAFDRRTGGTRTSAAHDHIGESIRQILGTRVGERFMRPDFGSRLHELVFEPNDAILKSLVKHYAIEAIQRWEKRITLTAVTFDEGSEGNTLMVRIAYRVIQSHTEGNLVYPFYREPLS